MYAHTREEFEEKLKALIVEMKAELAELKRQKADRHGSNGQIAAARGMTFGWLRLRFGRSFAIMKLIEIYKGEY